jgi:hypothetical protein
VGTGALRVYVESEESVEETPVLVVVRHEKGVLSWQLPLMLQVIQVWWIREKGGPTEVQRMHDSSRSGYSPILLRRL